MWFFICLTLTVLSIADTRVVSKAEVKTLTDEYFDFRIRENPNYASMYGIQKYQDMVEEWNYEAFNRRIRISGEFRRKTMSLLAEDEFEDRTDKVGLRILDYTLEKFIEGAEYLNFTVSINGDLTNIANQIQLNPVNSLEKLEMWYKRVIAYKTVFEDQVGLLNDGIRSGLTQAQINVKEYIEGYKTDIDDSVEKFFAFKPWIELNVLNTNRTFYDAGRSACSDMRESMNTFVNKLEKDYLPACRDRNHIGVSNLPGGANFYRTALTYFTSEDTTPETAHQLGLKEVDRITTAMKKIVADENFEGSIREFVDTLYQDPDETFPTSAAVLVGYEDMLNNRIRPKLSTEFSPEPDIGLDILDDPHGSLGRYKLPREENGKWTNGIFLYDGRRPKELLKIVMLPLMVHEGVPGHHYQASYVLAKTHLPDFRRYIAYDHYGQGGFNFPYYNAYAEGWALYSEYLSEIMGIIKTDREKLGKLSLESLRAARLVVDTGLHYYNWTMERAVDYLLENTILSNASCWSQVIRYVRWPGQACSYKIGELKIRRVREKAIRELGDDFDPRSFHDALLGLGPCPLELMEEEMESWIDDQKAKSTNATTPSSAVATHPFSVLSIFLTVCSIFTVTYWL